MKTLRIKRSILRLLILAAALLSLGCATLLPGQSIAATTQELWISETGELTAEAIRFQPGYNKKYLFLPGNIPLSEWKIGFNTETLIVNDQEIRPGEASADLLSLDEPNSLVFVNGKYKTKVRLDVMLGSRLPSIHITTETGSLRTVHRSKQNKEAGYLILYDEEGKRAQEGELAHIKMRGNSSVRFDKKNYALKLQKGENLLGMGKAKKWILTGNHLDKSLIRNQLNFDMARYAGLPYTPDCRQAAVYVNNQYLGLYLLSERIEIDDDRVNIRNLENETEDMNDKPLESYPVAGTRYANAGSVKGVKIPQEPEDRTGGYILEYDHITSKFKYVPSAYVTKRYMCLMVHEPEYCSLEQIRYISGIMQSFENAIFAKDGRDPGTGKHYTEIADFDSLVNKYLINEVSKNYDSNMASEYFFKPEDAVSEKIFAGPVWDLDNTYGMYARADNQSVLKPEDMLASRKGTQDFWWPALYRQADFYQAVVKRYHETFVPALEILLGIREESDTLKSLDTYAAAIAESAAMEYVLYPDLKNPNGQVQTGRNLAENIEYLKNYITRRMNYLSGVWIQDGAQ